MGDQTLCSAFSPGLSACPMLLLLVLFILLFLRLPPQVANTLSRVVQITSFVSTYASLALPRCRLSWMGNTLSVAMLNFRLCLSEIRIFFITSGKNHDCAVWQHGRRVSLMTCYYCLEKICDSAMDSINRLFATGSDDGSVCIWKFKEVGWTAIKLQVPKEELFQ